VKDRDPLEIDTPVSESEPVPGQIQASSDHPRSYIVSTPTVLVRQNRQHLNRRTSEYQPPPEPVELNREMWHKTNMHTRFVIVHAYFVLL